MEPKGRHKMLCELIPSHCLMAIGGEGSNPKLAKFQLAVEIPRFRYLSDWRSGLFRAVTYGANEMSEHK